ncbi:phage tail-collar fiber domain-containing protein [Bacillus chungangensis]|uniref:Phage tail protein n=1 Tax=Bacillus chungangensis TaxID=587633 RepID=A0ABT9WU48_9BACI|nr:phage tail protein [Bacillus chungangensis]MDQ0176701.1 hypothetical protein [Bacillus chungangensis]
MAENYYTILTNVGKAKIANAQVFGEKVVMTHLAVGDGNGMHYNPIENQTALRNEVWRGHIGSIDTDLENPNWIVLEATIPSNAGGFNVREVGVFDDEDNLIAIGKYPETYKPILTEGSAKDLYVRMIIEVTNAASVQLKIDPTIAMPSRKWVEEEIEKHAKTTASLTQRGHVQLSDDINSTSTAEAVTPSAVKAVNEKVTVHLDNKMNPHSVTASQVGAIPLAEKGKANGVASLGIDGKVPAEQLIDATTSRKGVVQLNSSLGSTSITEAATASTVNQVYDKISSRNVEIGAGALVKQDMGIAIGLQSKADGVNGSVALSYRAQAVGTSSIALGMDALASGSTSVAIGRDTKATDLATLALGDEAEVSGTGSVALGYRSRSLNKYEGVLGSTYPISANKWIVPGNFSVQGSKNFEIPHPAPHKKATHVIRHGAVESPTPGDTLYRYTIKATEDGQVIEHQLPDYFEHLNANVDVWVNAHKHFAHAFGEVQGGILNVTCEKAGEYNVLVIGTRNDDNVQEWYVKGVEREVGESWLGETYVFEVDEIIETKEMKEEVE